MGIRFACHACDHPLNIKQELAGRVGRCPECGERFRIPTADTDRSTPVEVSRGSASDSDAGEQTAAEPMRAPAEAAVASTGQAGSSVRMTAGAAVKSRPATSPLDDPSAQWYVRPPAGGQYGPAGGETIRLWISENRITPSTLLWREGWPKWLSARDVLPEIDALRPRDSIGDLPSGPTNAIAGRVSGVRNNNHSHAAAVDAADGEATDSGVALVGRSEVGQQRSIRSSKRLTLVIVLALTSILLLAVLLFLALRS